MKKSNLLRYITFNKSRFSTKGDVDLEVTLMRGKCLTCSADIYYGKLIEKDGRKIPEKFDLDEKTAHVCKTKEKNPRFVRKPSETFRFIHWVKTGEGTADQFEVSRTGNLGELNPEATFKELKDIVARLPK